MAVLLFSKNNLSALNAFKAGLRERGYLEGQGVEYVFEGAVETMEELDPAMAKLIARKPDLVYAAPTMAVLAAQKVCREKNIPVVFGPANNAVESGLVQDRKRPGGNITGVMLADSEAKRLQWTKELAPQINNIFVPYNPSDTSATVSIKTAQAAAVSLGLDLRIQEVRDHAEIDALIAQWPDGVDSIFLPRDAMIMSRIKDFADLAIRKKIVLSTGTRIEYVEKGALLSYGFDDIEMGRQVARLADQIFQGVKPGDLPIETAEVYLAINLKTARAIGISVDERFLRLARRILRPESDM